MTLRKKRPLAMSMFFCALLALTMVPPLYATTTYTITTPDGGDCSSHLGTWEEKKNTCTLTHNLEEDNIEIAGDDIILDCAGHSMSGLYSDDTGIHVFGRSGITIKNCIVRGGNIGIQFQYCTDSTIEGNTVEGSGLSSSVGIDVSNNSDITIDNCIVRGHGKGINLIDCTDSTVKENSVVRNVSRGISITGALCQYNTVKNNTAVDNNNYGIWITDCGHITVTGNDANWNRVGILSRDIYDSKVVGNNANANSDSGMGIGPAPNTLIKANTTNWNTYNGTNLGDSNNITVTGNTSNWNLNRGISLTFVDDSILKGNATNSNGTTGIFFEQCEGNTVEGNTANKNGYVNGDIGCGYIDDYYEWQTLANSWVDNHCTENYGGGSIHGISAIPVRGELCKPQF